MRFLLMKLPSALDALKEGKEPEHAEIYGIGSPTNTLGTVTSEFLARVKEHGAFDTFGDMYAGFVASRLPPETAQGGTAEVRLWGLSMGGSLALKTAETLLKNEQVTQVSRAEAERALAGNQTSPEERIVYKKSLALPHLAIRADIAPGISDFVGRLDMVRGFAQTGLQDLLTPYTQAWMKGADAFSKNVSRALKQRYPADGADSPEEEAMKNEILWPGVIDKVAGFLGPRQGKWARSTLVGGVIAGTPVPEHIKVTQVVGARDPYMTAIREKIEAVLEHADGEGSPKPQSLGSNLLERDNKNIRMAGAQMRHFHPWLSDTELRKMSVAVSAAQKLQRGE